MSDYYKAVTVVFIFCLIGFLLFVSFGFYTLNHLQEKQDMSNKMMTSYQDNDVLYQECVDAGHPPRWCADNLIKRQAVNK